MAARTSSLVHPKYKTKYSVKNWPEYEQGLRNRGDVMVWFSEEAVAAWIPRGTRSNSRRPSSQDSHSIKKKNTSGESPKPDRQSGPENRSQEVEEGEPIPSPSTRRKHFLPIQASIRGPTPITQPRQSRDRSATRLQHTQPHARARSTKVPTDPGVKTDDREEEFADFDSCNNAVLS